VTRRISLTRLQELWRYYQAGLVNALFGFSCYSLLVKLGMNMYGAQAVGMIFAITFNYVTYSRYVFRTDHVDKIRFFLSYVNNYLVNVAMLALTSLVIKSPYIAGFVAIVLTSFVNYFVLKYFVVSKRNPS
jgi:putative flippase GtrA